MSLTSLNSFFLPSHPVLDFYPMCCKTITAKRLASYTQADADILGNTQILKNASKYLPPSFSLSPRDKTKVTLSKPHLELTAQTANLSQS